MNMRFLSTILALALLPMSAPGANDDLPIIGKHEKIRYGFSQWGHFREGGGGVDILVNNAAILTPGTIDELSMDDWDRMMRINLRASVVSIKLALPHLRRSRFGRIINIASVNAFGGYSGPAKAGLINLTQDTAILAGNDSVTVNAICPGYIETAMQDYVTDEIHRRSIYAKDADQ